MITLFRKEINNFFSSLTGYLVIVVFLLANGLFIWVLPGDMNVLDNGYASLESLFALAPWVFLFLVPAVTMRFFAEEKRTGTLEILYTKPITDLQIILAKYFAGLLLVMFALLPTLIYFFTIYKLGDPVGNIDTGGTWGSYIGLFFLAAIYVAIGVFASSLTDNQIIAFIISMAVCFIFYTGFESLSQMNFLGGIASVIDNFGINAHYKSISRGVLDSRDIIYFASVISIFVFSTKIVLESRKW